MDYISLTDIQYGILKAVKTDTDFQTLCNNTIGETLNFYHGTDLMKYKETLPYMTAYKFNTQKQEGADRQWFIQFVLGIEAEAEPIKDSLDIIRYTTTDKIEVLAREALEVIRSAFRMGLITGNSNLRVVSENIIITEVGEADDVQAIVGLQIEEYSVFN